MDDLMLEQLISRAAAATAYPPTTPLRGRVAAALATPPKQPAWQPRLVRTALAIIALGVGATLAVPASRSAIADWFGVEGTKVERIPTPAPGVTPTPLPPAGQLESIATRVSIDEAERRTGFQPVVPGGAGDPRGVYVKTYAGTDTVAVLRFAAYDLWEARPRDIFFGKGLPEAVVKRDTTINGRPAYWIVGGPHVAYVYGETGALPGSERTVSRDTLIWRTDFALYRMETDLPLADSTRIAETLP